MLRENNGNIVECTQKIEKFYISGYIYWLLILYVAYLNGIFLKTYPDFRKKSYVGVFQLLIYTIHYILKAEIDDYVPQKSRK